MIRLYSYVSVVVVVLGMGLMSQKAPWDSSEEVGQIGDTWIWLSLLLRAAAMAVSLGVLAPSLTRPRPRSVAAGPPAARSAGSRPPVAWSA
jgi:hypothetical protein